ncbi:hypothetical protein BDA99DRAFT_267370 [Phascolomyces articulosus]|uniref:Yeast cell wall synthesis Kre9/Knh1-like N-terminal domain-containing protein n=1 Tax=Phascolomyces articulosus TaxID=60185 RepID=A0AAD5JMM0_9FUNG|nr:hypothetical protein BDA99DRAFT_267370 [Phascolomyces articulosus]
MRLLSLSIDNNNNKLLLLLLFIASIIHVVTGLSVGSPAAGTKIQGSAQFLVSWSVGPTENITSVDIELAQGLLIAVKTIATLASDVPAAGGSRTVSMPASISSANNYYIRVKGNNIPSSVATQGPITYVAATTLPDNNSTSAARPTSTSSFSLILPGSSSASLPHSSSGSSSISRNTNLPSGTSSSIAEETSNSSNSDAGKDKGSENNGDNGLSGGAIAGIAIGAVAGAGAVSTSIHILFLK